MVTVVGALIERDGRILVCQRTERQAHPEKWEFPGGKVEPGESLPDALRRELTEELGIDAAIGEEVERYEFAYFGRNPILLVFYRVREWTGQMENRVFARIEWSFAADLPMYDFLEGDVAFVRRLATTGSVQA